MTGRALLPAECTGLHALIFHSNTLKQLGKSVLCIHLPDDTDMSLVTDCDCRWSARVDCTTSPYALLMKSFKQLSIVCNERAFDSLFL